MAPRKAFLARRVAGTLLLAGSGVLATSACTKAQQQAKPAEAEAGLTSAQSKEMDEYRAEVEIGRNMAGRLLAYYGVIDDPQVLGYLNQVGGYVASYSDYPERRYMFSILKHESVNAFACPGGYVLVTLGALRAAHNEAEIAMILGHEIAHVGKKHMFDTLKSMKEKELAEKAKGAEALGLNDPIYKARSRPVAEETGAGAMLARYLSGSTGAALNVLQAAQAGMTLITSEGIGPELENEADSEGVKYGIRAGYHPRALIGYLKRIRANKTKLKNLGKTHPSPDARIANIKKLIDGMNADEIIGALGTARFKKTRASFPPPEKD
jgi:predicted Zn-dependent protease